MELMSGNLIPTSWNMKTKLALGHLVTCKLFLLDYIWTQLILVAEVSLCISLIFLRYRGTYCSQDVAIKVLKPERISTDMLKEFAQEVYIMRFVCMIDCSRGDYIYHYWDIYFSCFPALCCSFHLLVYIHFVAQPNYNRGMEVMEESMFFDILCY